jgi:hypothetical protein
VNPAIPDPLLRFVATPFGATVEHDWGSTRIECSDANLAKRLAVRFLATGTDALLAALKQVRIVVESGDACGQAKLTHLNAGPLRTLLRGTATVLIYDVEERLLLGFLDQNVTCVELFERLIPALVVGTEGRYAADGVTKE